MVITPSLGAGDEGLCRWATEWNRPRCSTVGVFLAGRCTRSVPVSLLWWHGLWVVCVSVRVASVNGPWRLQRRCQNGPAAQWRSRLCWITVRMTWPAPLAPSVVWLRLLVVAKVSLNYIMNCSTSSTPVKVGASSLYLYASSPGWNSLPGAIIVLHSPSVRGAVSSSMVSIVFSLSRTRESHRCHHCCDLYKVKITWSALQKNLLGLLYWKFLKSYNILLWFTQ